MKRIFYIIIFASCISIHGCYYDIQEELHPSTGPLLCDSGEIKFSGQVKSILQTNCYGCHTGSGASGSISLDNYAGVKAVADNGRLVGSIEHQTGFTPMPQNQLALSECDRLTIKKWIENGSPNN